MENENTQKENVHYVCLGGCKGVSENSGTCQAEDCASHNQDLTPCDCTDGTHNNFEKKS